MMYLILYLDIRVEGKNRWRGVITNLPTPNTEFGDFQMGFRPLCILINDNKLYILQQ